MYDSKLKGRNVLITGATSGVGLVMAKALCAGGCNLVISGPGDPQQVNNQCALLAEKNRVKVIYLNGDLSTVVGVEALLDESRQQLGSIDILINNASDYRPAPLTSLTAQSWNESLAINLSAAFYLIQRVLPMMQRSGWGRIINIAPVQALEASPLQASFSAAKYGLLGLTRAIAKELEPPGVTCNVICPGWSPAGTEILDLYLCGDDTVQSTNDLQTLSSSMGKALADQNPLAQLTLFLCSDAAVNLNGRVLPVAC